MKKTFLSLAVASVLVSSGVNGQEITGGSKANGSALGGISTGRMTAGAIVGVIAVAAVSNTNGVAAPLPTRGRRLHRLRSVKAMTSLWMVYVLVQLLP